MEKAVAKRKFGPDERDTGANKKNKVKKKWDMGRRKMDNGVIQAGDAGIWATCAMKKEAKSIGDLRDLFQEYATKLYPSIDGLSVDNEADSEDGDIEDEIQRELSKIRRPNTKPLFASVKLDTQCLIFFRTRSPVEPVSFVHTICQEIADGAQLRNLRYVKRITPMTGYEKATYQGLERLAKQVLAPDFHGLDQVGKKFAIRPSIRNNKEFTREALIKTVAAVVGPGHTVDLGGYELLILVEVYKNVVGMSVVGPDFDELKRFNLEELRQSVPLKEVEVETKGSGKGTL